MWGSNRRLERKLPHLLCNYTQDTAVFFSGGKMFLCLLLILHFCVGVHVLYCQFFLFFVFSQFHCKYNDLKLQLLDCFECSCVLFYFVFVSCLSCFPLKLMQFWVNCSYSYVLFLSWVIVLLFVENYFIILSVPLGLIPRNNPLPNSVVIWYHCIPYWSFQKFKCVEDWKNHQCVTKRLLENQRSSSWVESRLKANLFSHVCFNVLRSDNQNI